MDPLQRANLKRGMAIYEGRDPGSSTGPDPAMCTGSGSSSSSKPAMPRMQGGDLDEEQANKAIMGEVSDPDTEVHKPGVVGPPPMDTVRGGLASVAPNLPPGGAAGGVGGVGSSSSGAGPGFGPGIGGGLGSSTSLMGGFAGGGASGSWSK